MSLDLRIDTKRYPYWRNDTLTRETILIAGFNLKSSFAHDWLQRPCCQSFFPYKSRYRITLFAEMAILINFAVFSYLFLGSLHMNQNRFSQPCRSFLAYPPCDRRNLFSLSWTSFMLSIGFLLSLRPFDCLSRALTLTKVSSSHTRPARTPRLGTFPGRRIPSQASIFRRFRRFCCPGPTFWRNGNRRGGAGTPPIPKAGSSWSRTASRSAGWTSARIRRTGTSSERPKHDQSGSCFFFIVWRFAFCLLSGAFALYHQDRVHQPCAKKTFKEKK